MYRVEPESESLTTVVRQVMELRRESVVDLAGELAAVIPWFSWRRRWVWIRRRVARSLWIGGRLLWC